jgi:hypothetical protein
MLSTTLLPGWHLGAGTDPPSEVVNDLLWFLPPVKGRRLGPPTAALSQGGPRISGVLAWEQAYPLPYDLGRTAAPNLTPTGRSRCHFTLIPPGDTSKVRTPAPANRQPAANPEVGTAEHAFGRKGQSRPCPFRHC